MALRRESRLLRRQKRKKRQRDGWRAVERERGDEKLMGGGGEEGG